MLGPLGDSSRDRPLPPSWGNCNFGKDHLTFPKKGTKNLQFLTCSLRWIFFGFQGPIFGCSCVGAVVFTVDFVESISYHLGSVAEISFIAITLPKQVGGSSKKCRHWQFGWKWMYPKNGTGCPLARVLLDFD